MKLYKGEIQSIAGHQMSGLWQLILNNDIVHIESGYGVRQLASCFGATEGTGDLQEKITGQVIYYCTDVMGVLNCFIPEKELDQMPGIEVQTDDMGQEFIELEDQA